jgi:hypothetical protein
MADVNLKRKKSLVFVHKNVEESMKAMDTKPIIVNDLPLDTEEDVRFLESLTVTQHDTTDMIASRPTCLCKTHHGGHKVGFRCPKCGHVVSSPLLREIQADLWIAAPQEIGYLFSPLAWIMLSKPLTTRQFNGLAWMCNPFQPTPELNARATCKQSKVIKQFQSLGLKRGLKNVLDNFDMIFNQIILKSVANYQKRIELQSFVQKYRGAIFTRVIPLPSKVSMIVEKTPVGNYYDKTIDSAIEAAFTAAATSQETNISKLESRFTTVMSQLGNYYNDVVTNVLSSKKGWLRRVVYGNRLNFSYRNIITSRHEPHEYDTLLVPYHQLLTCLEFVVVRKLIKEHNFSHRQAYAYVNEHAKDKDPLIWSILEEIIDDTPALDAAKVSPVENELPSTLKTRQRTGRGLVTTLTRFPSLDRGSTQWFRIVGISDSDIQISILCVKGPNADFDGDQMNGELILDIDVANQFEYLAPHYNLHSTAEPGKLRHIADFPDPTVQTIANFIDSEEMVI